jgi:hypothetical protein
MCSPRCYWASRLDQVPQKLHGEPPRRHAEQEAILSTQRSCDERRGSLHRIRCGCLCCDEHRQIDNRREETAGCLPSMRSTAVDNATFPVVPRRLICSDEFQRINLRAAESVTNVQLISRPTKLPFQIHSNPIIFRAMQFGRINTTRRAIATSLLSHANAEWELL